MEPAPQLGPANLLPLNLDAASAWQPALRAALHQASAGSRLYLALQGKNLLSARHLTLPSCASGYMGLAQCLSANMHGPCNSPTTAGQAAARAPDAAQVTALARCYNEVAEVAPRLDMVPLTPSADWSPGEFDKTEACSCLWQEVENSPALWCARAWQMGHSPVLCVYNLKVLGTWAFNSSAILVVPPVLCPAGKLPCRACLCQNAARSWVTTPVE